MVKLSRFKISSVLSVKLTIYAWKNGWFVSMKSYHSSNQTKLSSCICKPAVNWNHHIWNTTGPSTFPFSAVISSNVLLIFFISPSASFWSFSPRQQAMERGAAFPEWQLSVAAHCISALMSSAYEKERGTGAVGSIFIGIGVAIGLVIGLGLNWEWGRAPWSLQFFWFLFCCRPPKCLR